ncbi:hypothetical protein GCM10018775_22530 [Streptomyces umbrinus]|nr:hypothetical protein GCM10018775_22530 [Streptomyces umbrinus]
MWSQDWTVPAGPRPAHQTNDGCGHLIGPLGAAASSRSLVILVGTSVGTSVAIRGCVRRVHAVCACGIGWFLQGTAGAMIPVTDGYGKSLQSLAQWSRSR